MKNIKRQKFGGRTKGTPNRNTREIRDNFQKLIENNMELLQQDISEMNPKDRVKTVLDLARFVIPTLKAVDLSASAESDITPVIINLGHGIDPSL